MTSVINRIIIIVTNIIINIIIIVIVIVIIVLAINHVFEMLVLVKSYGYDWREAIAMAMPKRQLQETPSLKNRRKKKNNNSNSNNPQEHYAA